MVYQGLTKNGVFLLEKNAQIQNQGMHFILVNSKNIKFHKEYKIYKFFNMSFVSL